VVERRRSLRRTGLEEWAVSQENVETIAVAIIYKRFQPRWSFRASATGSTGRSTSRVSAAAGEDVGDPRLSGRRGVRYSVRPNGAGHGGRFAFGHVCLLGIRGCDHGVVFRGPRRAFCGVTHITPSQVISRYAGAKRVIGSAWHRLAAHLSQDQTRGRKSCHACVQFRSRRSPQPHSEDR
jgi:hypothetical protein